MSIEIIKNNPGREYFKTDIEIVRSDHKSLGLNKTPSEKQKYTFDPRGVQGWFATDYEGREGFKQTHLEFYSGHDQVIDCTVEEFEELFFKL